MDKLTNRCRAFAEGVVVMVCPVLVALALKKVDLKSEEHGPAFPIVLLVIAGLTSISGICLLLACGFSEIFPTAGVIPTPVTRSLTTFSSACLVVLACLMVDLWSMEHGPALPIAMLVIAGVTLISSICPVLACSFYERFPTAGEIPTPVTRSLTPFSSAFLLILASLIAQLIIPKSIVISIGTTLGGCIVIRMVCYCYAQQEVEAENGGAIAQQDVEAARARREAEAEFYSKLDNSVEFLSGVTGILFLGLEGLALEGQINSSQGIQIPMVISFLACAFGVFFMFVEMIPPLEATMRLRTNISLFTMLIIEGIMALGAIAVLVVITLERMGRPALLLSAPAFLILLQLVLEQSAGNNANANEESKPASLELTKVTFAGFLAVSVATISKSRSPNKWTETDWFLLFAAGAIVSGLAWRLLTHFKSKTTISANVASFFTHLFIVIATILLVVMAGKALS